MLNHKSAVKDETIRAGFAANRHPDS